MNIKDSLDNCDFLGVVEDNLDPKRKGRVKVRVEKLHGRPDDTFFI